MNNDDAAPLKKVIEELLETYNLKSGFTQVRIQRIWSQIVGRHIAKRTSEIRLKNDTLFVRLNSAALRTELSFAKTKIIRNLNRQLGEDIIKEIVFI
ncbi:MAG TPA: DUF721 domain-containing protein [Bacteroidales bacterium]|jgi:predicted nucleic acid-binding Zn ribbon protein|nr:DUF721 domain-containing protein [Bacteroidales bacterium]OQC56649.1 MAG: hypothetical protein BWX51_02089 [Bacteroidetes bacterium ADurb.Bin012]HNU22605.1 DUF721 domain-containing protein [Bacteroidales bacterium]HNV18018.1 DUF721 domain-containing protein [Bacteroidales bacterium]HNZ80235.1 DUF721 domain-containing protein [Bacteroidales bacterium]